MVLAVSLVLAEGGDLPLGARPRPLDRSSDDRKLSFEGWFEIGEEWAAGTRTTSKLHVLASIEGRAQSPGAVRADELDGRDPGEGGGYVGRCWTLPC